VSEESEPVPKLPRGRGFRLTGPEVFRILITLAMLIAVLVLAKPCGNAMSNFVMGFDNGNGSARGSAIPHPGTVEAPGSAAMPDNTGDYVELHPGMTDEQVQQAIDQAKAKAKARQHAGSAGSAASSTP
jgi:hypothetical protein